MEVLPVIILIIVFVITAFMILKGLFMIVGGVTVSVFESINIGMLRLYPKKHLPEYHDILIQKFPYYKSLSEENRQKFLIRLHHFMLRKKFIPVDIPEVTLEMKTLISASAIQLTFGLRRYIFPYFKHILIHPKVYYSARGQAYHKGGVDLKGTINLSYDDFVKGYAIPDDSINLGLHEMAHALNLEYVMRDEYDYFFGQFFPKWEATCKREFIMIHNGYESILRKYAGTNMKEFFAVCVENFFERPKLFMERLPEIFTNMTILLNQDPSAESIAFDERLKFSGNELPFDKNAATPLYEGPYPTNRIYSALTLLIVFALFYALSHDLPYSILGIFVLGIFSLLSNYTRYYVYPDHLVITRYFFFIPTHYVFDYNMIISLKGRNMDMSEDGGFMTLSVTHMQDGKITETKFGYRLDDEFIRVLVERLKERNIRIKIEGLVKRIA